MQARRQIGRAQRNRVLVTTHVDGVTPVEEQLQAWAQIVVGGGLDDAHRHAAFHTAHAVIRLLLRRLFVCLGLLFALYDGLRLRLLLFLFDLRSLGGAGTAARG